MSRINVDLARRVLNRGFTLLEMVIALAIACVVLAATLGAYTFMARNLSRLAGDEEQQTKSRRMTYLFTQDVGAATGAVTAAPTNLVLTIYSPTPSPTPPAVSYTYNGAAQTFSRDDGSGNIATLSGVSNATLSYFDGFDQPVTTSPVSITNIGLDLTLAPPASAGSGAPMTAVNARVVLRNKPLLGDGHAMPTPTPTPS